MPKILTDNNLDELCEESEQTGQIVLHSNELETVWQGDLGYSNNIYGWQMRLPDGLEIWTETCEIAEDFIFISQNSDSPRSCLSFFVSANCRTLLHGLTDEVDEIVGHNYLSCTFDTKKLKPGQQETISKEFIFCSIRHTCSRVFLPSSWNSYRSN